MGVLGLSGQGRFKIANYAREENMNLRAVTVGVALLSLGMSGATGAVRQSRQPLSPPANATCRFSDGKTITVDYSSPRVRGREIFGHLVPYGQVWILGANEATTFDTAANVTAGGTDVPAGNYTLFAIPNLNSWTLIFSKSTREEIGRMSYYPGQSSDFARVPMTSSKLPLKQEDFTISFVPGGNSCMMRFDWELTRASISITEGK
jgi:hypothetical protein